jgi:hypothetical protein
MLASLLVTAAVTAGPPAATVADGDATLSGLAVVPARVDLGARAAGTAVTQRVWLVNTSIETITVETTSATCGCTTADGFAPTTLAPGAAHPVDVTVEIPGRAGTTRSPKMSFHPAWGAPVAVTLDVESVATADVDTPATDDPAPVRLIAAAADLGVVPTHGTIETSAWIVNDGPTPVTVSTFKAGCGCTTVVGFAPTEIAPHQATRVRLRIATKEAKESKRVSLTARLDDDASVSTAVTMTVDAAPARRRPSW